MCSFLKLPCSGNSIVKTHLQRCIIVEALSVLKQVISGRLVTFKLHELCTLKPLARYGGFQHQLFICFWVYGCWNRHKLLLENDDCIENAWSSPSLFLLCLCFFSFLLCAGCWWRATLAVWNHLHLLHTYFRHAHALLTFTADKHIFLYHPQEHHAVLTPQGNLLKTFTVVKGTSVSDEREISREPWSHSLAGLFSISVSSTSVSLSV